MTGSRSPPSAGRRCRRCRGPGRSRRVFVQRVLERGVKGHRDDLAGPVIAGPERDDLGALGGRMSWSFFLPLVVRG